MTTFQEQLSFTKVRQDLNEVKELLEKKKSRLSGNTAYAAGDLKNCCQHIRNLESDLEESEKNHTIERLSFINEAVKAVRRDIEDIKIEPDLSGGPSSALFKE